MPAKRLQLLFVLTLLCVFWWTPAPADSTVRVMAANISSGNYQSYDPGEGTRIFQGIDPDVVLIQEFNYGDNSASTVAAWVSSTFGSGFDHFRESGAQIPNGVISRWPIIDSGEWTDPEVSNRDFAWARIDIPGDTDLWAVSVHLLTSGSGVRNTEAAELVDYIEAQVPAGDYLVIGGDFNTASRSEAALSTLAAVVDTGGPYPADQEGTGGTNASRAKPYDWVLADSDFDILEVPLEIGASTYTNGLVFDSRVYTPLSEVSPVQSGDSAASNMQHMAVVRDFRVPANGGGDDGGGDPEPGDPQTLLDVSGSLAEGRWRNYTVQVESGIGELQIEMTGSGDGDLYVRHGDSYPTQSQWDFRPYEYGSDESVTINASSSPALQTGQYWISVYGYEAASFSIVVTAE
ncbi:MAG: endonuclease/exonuclease/phosphatase family protein [Gammaproteobacteria bacterium]|nr:endonuclease/exonuclease/phosphatase family protein [Gammaproteobacteria bacterium]